MLKNTGVSKFATLQDVQRLRDEQDIVQSEQIAQKQAIQTIQEELGRLQAMGSEEVYGEIAQAGHDMAYNARNLAQETRARAMQIVNEDMGKARIADGQAANAATNIEIVQNAVRGAADDILSGREARTIEESIRAEKEHLEGVRDTTLYNAEELQRNTNVALQVADDTARKIIDLLPR